MSADYHEFGMNMEGRGFSGSLNYAHGYQGSRMDNEINNAHGTSYTTEFRQLDTRLGRWFSSDPILQPFQSSYTSMDNNPINLTDVRGDKIDGGKPNIFRRAWNTLTGKTSRGKQKQKVGGETNDKEPSSPSKLKQFANSLGGLLSGNGNFPNDLQKEKNKQEKYKAKFEEKIAKELIKVFEQERLANRINYDDFENSVNINNNIKAKKEELLKKYGSKKWFNHAMNNTNQIIRNQSSNSNVSSKMPLDIKLTTKALIGDFEEDFTTLPTHKNGGKPTGYGTVNKLNLNPIKNSVMIIDFTPFESNSGLTSTKNNNPITIFAIDNSTGQSTIILQNIGTNNLKTSVDLNNYINHSIYFVVNTNKPGEEDSFELNVNVVSFNPTLTTQSGSSKSQIQTGGKK